MSAVSARWRLELGVQSPEGCKHKPGLVVAYAYGEGRPLRMWHWCPSCWTFVIKSSVYTDDVCDELEDDEEMAA
jgi:hypothetical protein